MFRWLIVRCLVLLWVGFLAQSGVSGAAFAYETTAQAAILIDLETDQVLYEKNPDLRLQPASMSKLMTALMVFERLQDGSLTLDDTLPVSKKAWRKGGSKMFVEVGKRVRVEDLLRGIIIQSGNDACIVVAEAFAGSEEAFARQMTERGRALGLTNTTFMNASGWPHPEHLMTVRDLARLAEILIEDYPEYYSFFAEREFVFSDIRQYSRNPLLGRFPGADGLKTGYTDDAGYGVTASASRDGRRLIMVIAGLDAARQRAGEAERLLEYGFREFKNYRLFEAGQVIDSADIWLGEPGIVPLIVEQEVHLSLTRAGRQKLEAKVVYDGPIPAPVQSGSTIAHLELTAPDFEPRRLPLVAGAEIEAVGLLGRFTSALGYLIWGSS